MQAHPQDGGPAIPSQGRVQAGQAVGAEGFLCGAAAIGRSPLVGPAHYRQHDRRKVPGVLCQSHNQGSYRDDYPRHPQASHENRSGVEFGSVDAGEQVLAVGKVEQARPVEGDRRQHHGLRNEVDAPFHIGAHAGSRR